METKIVATKDRILDAAERLFAEKGFAQTSLRDITAAAEVNLAAVNYHFQSKDALILAVFARRITPVNQERLSRLDALEARYGDQPIPIEDLVRAFMEPALRKLTKNFGQYAGRLMGRLFSEPGELFERVFTGYISMTAARYLAATRRSMPHLSEADIYWRFMFCMGAAGHTVAGLKKIEVISGGRCDATDIDGLCERLIAFMVAGFSGPALSPSKGDTPCNASH